MPYSNIGELPDEVKSRYSARCQSVFVKAFNNAAENGASEADCFKVAHTAAGMCKDSGKTDYFGREASFEEIWAYLKPDLERIARAAATRDQPPVSKAAPLDAEEMEAWYTGKIPRRLLAIPFGGFIPSFDGKGRDLDLEYFDEDTDIKPDWFTERPTDWHHSQDPTGKMNGAIIAKATDLHMEDDGWWVNLWANVGEKRLALMRRLEEKGAEIFGSSYAYPNLVKRGKAGHIDVWPYMMQTLSTSPQNRLSVQRPAKAVLDAFTAADIAVEPVLADILTELDTLRNLAPTSSAAGLLLAGDGTGKAGRELSGANLAEMEEWLEMLDSIAKRAKSLRDRVRSKYEKPEGVPST